jgi:hypothetical protein
MAHPSDEYHRRIGRTEQVLVDGRLLTQVLEADELRPGTFHADPKDRRELTVCLQDRDPPGRDGPGVIEVGRRAQLAVIEADWVVLEHLRFHYATNHAQQGAVAVRGQHTEVRDCEVAHTNGLGLELAGRDNLLERVECRENGQMGMSGEGWDNRMLGCRLIGNNVKGFHKAWEAGGIKVVMSRGFEIRDSVALGNDGPGFWFDIDNREELIQGCWAEGNHGPGIMIEISETATIRSNVCYRNGLRDEEGAWGHAGILLAESLNCLVEGNLCVGNRSGIAVRQQDLRTLPVDPEWERPAEVVYDSHGHTVRGNVAAFNTEWQFALFGDNPFFERFRGSASAKDLARWDPDQRAWTMERNLYWPGGPGGLICWGAPWQGRHVRYSDLEAFRKDRGLEQASRIVDPRFADHDSGDLSLSTDSPALVLNPELPRSSVRAERLSLGTTGSE